MEEGKTDKFRADYYLDTADEYIPSVYTHSMKTNYLSLRAQVDEGTILRKSSEF